MAGSQQFPYVSLDLNDASPIRSRSSSPRHLACVTSKPHVEIDKPFALHEYTYCGAVFTPLFCERKH